MTTIINASTSSGLVNSADTSGILQLQTASTAALTIDASQNVGIGITSPTRKLAVSGTWTNTGDYLMDSGSPQLAWTSGDLRFKAGGLGGTEVVRIDSSGNVGIGVTPSTMTQKTIELGASGNVITTNGSNDIQIAAGGYYNAAWKYAVTGSAVSNYYQDNGIHVWRYAASGTTGNTITWSEAARIDTSGNLLVGCTSVPTAGGGGAAFAVDSNSRRALVLSTSTTSSNTLVTFCNPNGYVGNISVSGSSTAFNTSSDYRLKENISPMKGALANISRLKPVTYKWKVDGSDSEGFIAHELAEVCPHAVTGEKDAIDAEGNPVYQGIDVSFLVATLTAALQELKAINDTQAETINALTARIVALESK